MRQYAKRQWQWFRKETQFRWVKASSPTLEEDVLGILNESPEEKQEKERQQAEARREREREREDAEEERALMQVFRRYQPTQTIFGTQEERAKVIHRMLTDLSLSS